MKKPTRYMIEVPSVPTVADGMGRTVSPAFTHCALILLFLLVITAFSGCKPREHAQPKPHWFKHYTQFHEKEYIQFIEDQIYNETDTSLVTSMTRDFYRSRHFQPFWTQKGLQEAFTDSLLATLANAYPQHGIPAEYFHLDSIRHAISQLVEHEIPNNDELYPHLYRLERQLTDQYLRYACALRFGAVNPKAVHGSKWYYETLSPDSAFLMTTLDNMHRFADYLPELYPQSADYKTLQKE